MDRRPDFSGTGMLKIIGVLMFLLLAASAVNQYSAHAYQLLDLKWPDPSTTFHVDIPGADGLWDEAFEGAMYEWSSATVFQYYIVRGSFSDPCDPNDERNGVRFYDTNCGDAWGSTTLAVCNYWYVGSTLVEADIVFNSNKDWNVYWTPWQSDVVDFRRVAVHELGHALGLAHEDSGVPAIMRTYADDITTPQQDDIAGVAAIYGSTVCTFDITPSRGGFPSGGGPNTVSVTASDSSCSWTVSHSLSWVHVSPFGGTGSRNVTVTVSPNSGAARSGAVTIAGRTYTISQDAVSCTFGITPSGGSFPFGGKTNTVSVTASDSSCSWTVVHSLSWVHVSPSGGTGSRNVTITAGPNTGGVRSGPVAIGDKTYTVIQAAVNDAPVSGLTKTQVSQLYVAVFGRASEGSGNAFWQSEPDMATAADDMLDTQAARDYFGDSLNSNQAFVEHIYLNTLNKTMADDAAGILFWTAMLDQGATRGETTAALINVISDYAPGGRYHDPDDAATVAAYNQFTNRVIVSDYMAENVFPPPDGWQVSTSFSLGMVVTDDPVTAAAAMTDVDSLTQ